jgi:hypothetical protein
MKGLAFNLFFHKKRELLLFLLARAATPEINPFCRK